MVIRYKLALILVVVLLACGTVIVFSPQILLAISMSIGTTELKMIDTVRSPDANWILAIYDIDSGVLGGNNLYFNLRRSTRPFRHHWGRELLFVRGQPRYEIDWEQTKDLEITLFGDLRKEENVWTGPTRVRDISIKYVLLPSDD